MTTLNRANKQVEMTPDYLTNFKAHHKLNDKQLAQILGVSPPAIQLWESGQRTIPETTARLLILFSREPELMDEFKAIRGTYTSVRLA